MSQHNNLPPPDSFLSSPSNNILGVNNQNQIPKSQELRIKFDHNIEVMEIIPQIITDDAEDNGIKQKKVGWDQNQETRIKRKISEKSNYFDFSETQFKRKISDKSFVQELSEIQSRRKPSEKIALDEKNIGYRSQSTPVFGVYLNDSSLFQDECSETKSAPQGTYRKEIMEEKEVTKTIIIVLQIFMFQVQATVQVFFTMTLGQLVVSHGATNSQLAVWSLQNYPWAFKFLLAPLMETYYFQKLGPRKTYFIMTSLVISAYVFFISICMSTPNMSDFLLNYFTILIFILMVILSLNQISVQIWSVEMLKDENRHISNFTMQFGQIFGAILSYNLFIFLNNIQFCNEYLYSSIEQQPILIQSQYLQLLTIYILCITFAVQIMFVDQKELPQETLKEKYHNILCVLKNKNLFGLSCFFLASPIMMGPVGVESGIILLRKGLQVLTVDEIQFFTIPASVVFVYIGHKLSLYKRELTMYLFLQILMLMCGIYQFFLVQIFNQNTNYDYICILLKIQVFMSSAISSMQTILVVNFYIRNLDPDPRYSLIWLQFNYCVFALKSDITSTLYIYLMNYFSYESLCIFSFTLGTLYYITCARWLQKFETLPKYEFEAIYIEDSNAEYSNFDQ